MIDQLVRDYTNSIADADVAIAETIGNLRLLERDHEEDVQASTEWGNKALAASRKADEMRASATPPTPTSSTTWPRSLSSVRSAPSARPRAPSRRSRPDRDRRQAQERPERHEDKLVELKNKRSELLARAKVAEAQTKVQDAVGSINVLDPTSELGRFEDKVRRQEAIAQGKIELAASSLDAQSRAWKTSAS